MNSPLPPRGVALSISCSNNTTTIKLIAVILVIVFGGIIAIQNFVKMHLEKKVKENRQTKANKRL